MIGDDSVNLGGLSMARTPSTPGRADDNSSDDRTSDPSAREIELLHVLVSRTGTHVDAQWGIHPQLKRDLLPNEWKEVTDLMAKVTDIVGRRFAQVLSRAESTSSGHA
jgi:hypothetical protein